MRRRAPAGKREFEVPAEHELLAPTLLRSQTLSALHEAVHAGELAPDVALDRLTRIRAIPAGGRDRVDGDDRGAANGLVTPTMQR